MFEMGKGSYRWWGRRVAIILQHLEECHSKESRLVGGQKEPTRSGSHAKMGGSDSGGCENFKSLKHMAELSLSKGHRTTVIPEPCSVERWVHLMSVGGL